MIIQRGTLNHGGRWDWTAGEGMVQYVQRRTRRQRHKYTGEVRDRVDWTKIRVVAGVNAGDVPMVDVTTSGTTYLTLFAMEAISRHAQELLSREIAAFKAAY